MARPIFKSKFVDDYCSVASICLKLPFLRIGKTLWHQGFSAGDRCCSHHVPLLVNFSSNNDNTLNPHRPRQSWVIKIFEAYKLSFLSVPVLIEMISVAMSLERGDVIITGTPGGVGVARKPAPVFMQPGDIFEVEIEQLGVLTNSVQDG